MLIDLLIVFDWLADIVLEPNIKLQVLPQAQTAGLALVTQVLSN